VDPIESPRSTRPSRVATRIAVVFLAAGLVAVATFAAWRVSGTRTAAPTQNAVIELAVDGMSCVGCAGAVASTLEDVPGVAEVTVDYDQRTARIRLSDTTVQPATLVAAVEDAGYKAHVER
jgi:mercuric ion binding protein